MATQPDDLDLHTASPTHPSAELAEPETELIELSAPRDGVPPVIANDSGLAEVAAAIAAGSGPIAVDAERAGGYRYSHSAYLIQLRRAGSGSHLVDPVTIESFDSLSQAMAGSEWIIHAASQDLPCLHELGLQPDLLFDTEMAARILGRPKVGLAALASSELGISLAKEHSAADWSARPLPESWLRYAALDVELLIDLRNLLYQDLERTGRLEWAREEFEYIRTAPARAPRTEPWRRTSGIHRIRSRRGLAIVQQVWLARDQLAFERDIAPGRVLPDAAITAAGLKQPNSRMELAAMPEYSGRGTKRRLEYWWTAVVAGRDIPDSKLPELTAAPTGPPPPRSWADRAPEAAARLAAAKAFLAGVSDDLGIPVENILTPDIVRRICWDPPEDSQPSSVSDFLATHGARQWQIQLVLDGLVEALGHTELPSPQQ